MVLVLLVWYEKAEGDMKGGRKINLLANRLIVACIDTIDHPSIELVATHPLWWPSAREGHKSAAEAPLLAHLTNGANNGGIHPLFRSNLSFRAATAVMREVVQVFYFSVFSPFYYDYRIGIIMSLKIEFILYCNNWQKSKLLICRKKKSPKHLLTFTPCGEFSFSAIST